MSCRLVRVGAVFAQTIFEGVVFHPDSSQILTCGSNNKVKHIILSYILDSATHSYFHHDSQRHHHTVRPP